MGMEEPFGTVNVTRKSGVLSLVVGKSLGGKQRFLSADADTSSSIKAMCLRKRQLMEGRVHPLNRFSATRVEVTSGDQTRAMEQQNSADKRKAYWADPNTPETRDETGETWVFKALDIKTKQYVQGEAPANLESVFTIKVSNADEDWTLEVHRATGDETATYYGKSDFTRGWVELNAKAADAGDDLEAFLGGPATE